ncbi:MAG: lipoyl(octanoyl) transferase LipB [Anaerolineae bacterium]
MARSTGHLLTPGMMSYREAWAMQQALAEARADGAISNVLILLEHPHTYTLGRSGHIEHLLMDEAERQRRGVDVLEVDRGGDITYHGPGQLVIYPIRFLGVPDPSGRLPAVDYIGYIRALEEVLIRTLAVFGAAGRRYEGYTGVWVDTPAGPEKVAAIGVKVNARGVSMHGAALNVNPDLTFFSGIIPCGIPDKPVTSLHRLLGEDCPSLDQTAQVVSDVFSAVFDERLIPACLDDLLPSTAAGNK